MEPLDIEQPEALVAYLRATGRVGPTEAVHTRPLSGGVSNRTVLVRRGGETSWVLKQALAKLRVPVDWFSSPTRIHREALGLRWLSELTPAGTVPPFAWEDPDEHLLAMEAVPEPHETWKALLLRDGAGLEHAPEFGGLLGTIHRRAWERRDEVAPVFADRSFFESLRVEPYYRFTAGRDPEAATFLESLIADSDPVRVTLVHGDYSPKNILVHAGRLILIDHEVIHFGDPAFDLGFSMAHLFSKAHHLEGRRGAFSAAIGSYWRAYRETIAEVPWAGTLEERAVRHTLGCLLARVAGRSQLEYLSAGERQRQRAIVVELMRHPAHGFAELVDAWTERLERLPGTLEPRAGL